MTAMKSPVTTYLAVKYLSRCLGAHSIGAPIHARLRAAHPGHSGEPDSSPTAGEQASLGTHSLSSAQRASGSPATCQERKSTIPGRRDLTVWVGWWQRLKQTRQHHFQLIGCLLWVPTTLGAGCFRHRFLSPSEQACGVCRGDCNGG